MTALAMLCLALAPLDEAVTLEAAFDRGDLETFAARAKAVADALAPANPLRAEQLYDELFWSLANLEEPTDWLSDAILAQPQAPPLAAALAWQAKAGVARSRGDAVTFNACVTRAEELVRPLLADHDLHRKGLAAQLAGQNAYCRGDQVTALSRVREAAEALAGSPRPWMVVRALEFAASIELSEGRVDDARKGRALVAKTAADAHLPFVEAIVFRTFGRTYLPSDNFDEQTQALARATAGFAAVGRWGHASLACTEYLASDQRSKWLAMPRMDAASYTPEQCLAFAQKVVNRRSRVVHTIEAVAALVGDVRFELLRRLESGTLNQTTRIVPDAAERARLQYAVDVSADAFGDPGGLTAVELLSLRVQRLSALRLLGKRDDVLKEARAALEVQVPPNNPFQRVVRLFLADALVQTGQADAAAAKLRDQVEFSTNELREVTDGGALTQRLNSQQLEYFLAERSKQLSADATLLAEVLEAAAGLRTVTLREPFDGMLRPMLPTPPGAAILPRPAKAPGAKAKSALDEAAALRTGAPPVPQNDSAELFWQIRLHAFRGAFDSLEKSVLEYSNESSSQIEALKLPPAVEVLKAAIAMVPDGAGRARLQCRLGDIRADAHDATAQGAVEDLKRCVQLARKHKEKVLLADALLKLVREAPQDPQELAWLEEALALTNETSYSVKAGWERTAELKLKKRDFAGAVDAFRKGANIEHREGDHGLEALTLCEAEERVAAAGQNVLGFELADVVRANAAKEDTWAQAKTCMRFELALVGRKLHLEGEAGRLRTYVLDRWAELPDAVLSEGERADLAVARANQLISENKLAPARAEVDRAVAGTNPFGSFLKQPLFRTVLRLAPLLSDGPSWFYRCLAELAAHRLAKPPAEVLAEIRPDGSGLANDAVAERVNDAVRPWVPEELGLDFDLRWPVKVAR